MGDSTSHCGQRGHSPGWVSCILRGMEASQLPGWVCLRGMEASQLPGCVCVVFCGEWRRVSFRVVCVLSSAGNGGESASRGAKGNGGESALELGVVVVYFLFFGGGAESASRAAKGNGGESALELGVVVVYFLFFGGGQLPGGRRGNGGELALELGVVVVYFLFLGGPTGTGSPNLVSLTLVAPMSQMQGSQHSVEDHRLVDTPAAPPARHRSLPPGRFESISATYAFQHHIPARQSRASPTWRLRYLARHLPGIGRDSSHEKRIRNCRLTRQFRRTCPALKPPRPCPA